MSCFTCLKKSSKSLNVFDNEDANIAYIIEQHLNLKPLPNKNPSVKICKRCWKMLREFHDFYEDIRTAHSQLLPVEKILLEGTEAERESFEFVKKENGLDEFIYDEINHIPLVETEIKQFADKDTIDIDETECEQKFSASDDDEYAQESFRNVDTVLDEIKNESEGSYSDSDLDYCDKSVKLKKASKKKIKTRRKQNSADRPCKPKRIHISLDDHKEFISKHIQMLCQLCTHISEDFTDLTKHFKTQHPNVKPFIKCCERKLDYPSDILQHARFHENPEHFKCKECNKICGNMSILNDHMRKYHEPEENLQYGCDQCPRRFTRRNLLEHHKSKHIPKEERSIYCNQCKPPKAFATEYIFQLHEKTIHKKRPNICHVCAKEIKDKQAFEKHVRSHFDSSNAPRIQCPREGCERWLKDEDNLKQHLRRFHDQTQQHECPQCGRICKNKHALTCHLRTTHTDKFYTCELCDKRFKKPVALKEHMAGHTGEPLYSCPFCDRKFNSSANMYSHRKKMHPVEWEQSNQNKINPMQSV